MKKNVIVSRVVLQSYIVSMVVGPKLAGSAQVFYLPRLPDQGSRGISNGFNNSVLFVFSIH